MLLWYWWIYFSDYGQYKVEAKTKTSSGVEFTSNGSSSHDSGAFTGSLETKYKWSDHGEQLKTFICNFEHIW